MHLDDWLWPAFAVLVLILYLGKNIRFLMQGRWYRRLNAAQQDPLRQANNDWEAYHGRQIPRAQLIAGVLAAVLVLGYLIGNNLGLFGR